MYLLWSGMGRRGVGIHTLRTHTLTLNRQKLTCNTEHIRSTSTNTPAHSRTHLLVVISPWRWHVQRPLTPTFFLPLRSGPNDSVLLKGSWHLSDTHAHSSSCALSLPLSTAFCDDVIHFGQTAHSQKLLSSS